MISLLKRSLKRHWEWLVIPFAAAFLGYILIDSPFDRNAPSNVPERSESPSQLPAADIAANGNTVLSVGELIRDMRSGKKAPETPNLPLPKVDRPTPTFNSTHPQALKVEKNIHQKWHITNRKDAAAQIISCLKAQEITNGSSHLARFRDRLELDITMRCEQLIGVVRQLDACGYEFSSWQPPYPENNLFSNAPQELIRYQAVFE